MDAKLENNLEQIMNCFDNLYDELVELVEMGQGEKGYISTNPKRKDGNYNDTIYCILYDNETENGIEEVVYGVRVEDGDLQVLPKMPMRTYDNAPTEEELGDGENWYSVRYSDVYLIPTLINIGENLWEYID